VLRKLAKVGALFRGAVIEHLHFSELIRIWGCRKNAILFVDPPYHGTEGYYSRSFARGDHVFLAEQLSSTKAAVVCTYYRTPLIQALYPETHWSWQSIAGTKNCCLSHGNKVVTDEWVIIRKA
jgi:site-specific DNA-adenine methylase